ncbi:adenosylmethionine decarboxylase [Sediminitomix flava]|uniref:S-adenosylmethionine decarboxylase proenzyme n=1 Tax=Sediminitomix flava TaxID=379075 RepID=A0A315ZAH9_SEDFL|nr:adenosylmethionine decarboxylase [Sediminitomix flava]PWJ42350.1 adenosylmethionine decarboxylase proenzyme [Sediminitomix flava]
MSALGIQLLGELSGCDKNLINDVEKVEQLMIQAAEKANTTIVKSVFHRFSPHGVSGVVVIQESHLAIHTWPEYGYASIDFFTCGDVSSPKIACEFLAEAFKAEQIEIKEVERGGIIKPETL